MRATLNKAVRFRGVGLHTGQPVMMTVSPAAAGAGIVFHRIDAGPAARPIPGRLDHVCDTRLCTRLANADGLEVGTVEHLMAALAGCGIGDVRIMLNGPEVPLMDGSAVGFVRGFLGAGIRGLGAPRRAIRLLAPVSANLGERMAALSPAPRFEMDFSVSFADPAIGTQSRQMALSGGAIVAELSDSRTFGCLSDIATLHAMGLARGGRLDNAVIVDNGRVLIPGGLRHADEFVRHKMLDAVGDLALAGAPVIGRYTGVRAGHEVTVALLRALFARPDCWEWCTPARGQLPGGYLIAPPLSPTEAPIAV